MAKNLEQLEQQIATAMGDGSAEGQSIAPVLREEQKTASIWDIGMIWAGTQIIVGTWAVGALATTVFGLDLAGALTAIIFGNIIGGLMVGTTSLMGRHGAPQMLLSRYSLGIKGAALTSFFNFISTIGWFSANTMLTALASFQIFDVLGIQATLGMKAAVVAVIVGLQIWLGLTNFQLMKKIEMILVVPMMLLIIVMSFIALRDISWATPASGPAGGSSFNYWSMWISAAGSVGISYLGSWAPYASDFSRFFKFNGKKAERQAFWVPVLVGAVLGIWLEVIGAVFATRFQGADPALHIAKAVPALALPALVIVLGGLFSTNVLNLVTGGLSAKVIWKVGRRVHWTTAIAIIGSLVACYSIFVSDVATVYKSFLLALLIWQAPWFAILAVDYFVIRKRDYRIADLYRLNTFIPAFNKAGMIAYAAGFVAAALTSFTGKHELLGVPLYSPIMLNHFNGMDVSFFAGSLVAGLLYYLIAERPAPVAAAVGETAAD